MHQGKFINKENSRKWIDKNPNNTIDGQQQ